ncbi:MAG: hypothetical protein M1837_004212 [Sclerophora amabilis]|nr:MAG: hypothetical protein M1837_004212 [Sclerophora amabilis]
MATAPPRHRKDSSQGGKGSRPEKESQGSYLGNSNDSPGKTSAKDQPILPYASEPFGVYQPLIGWRSQLQHERLATAVTDRVKLATTAILRATTSAPETPRIRRLRPRNFEDRTGTMIGQALVEHLDDSSKPNLVELLKGKADSPFPKMTQRILKTVTTPVNAQDDTPEKSPNEIAQALHSELGTATVLEYLSKEAPLAVNAMFHPSVSRLDRLVSGVKFFTDQHPAKSAFLSPIGLLHLFRQYFFQIGTFLGPPVGHVWISPGGTVELVEVNTRRQLVERTMEQSMETVTKTEVSTTDKDELSDAVKVENASDTKLGASATASGGVGAIFQASGTVSFNLDNSRKQAQEQTHKKMREQSSKLSSEVRQNYKTTFRTVTETTDTSSRRYVLQNTSQRLVSYELSRKMRKVAVQVQDLGQRLCWQLYVDNPGDPLGTGEFVYSAGAELDPNLKPPEHQTVPSSQPKTFSGSIPFLQTRGGDSDIEDTYTASPNNRDIGVFTPKVNGQNWVTFKHVVYLPPTPADFEIKEVTNLDFHGAQITVDPNIELDAPNARFTLWLLSAKWSDTKQIPFEGVVSYAPTKEHKDKVDQANREAEATYTQELQHEKEKAFYETLRTRLKLAGQVRPRPQDDLREEERNVIYRTIVSRLYGNPQGWSNEDYHVASELIRYFFDIDSMLYFVAPDWWRPRTQVFKPLDKQANEQFGSSIFTNPVDPLSAQAASAGKGSSTIPGVRPHYLITEESAPAPHGASLGWLIQLDGDTHRNAFLNSPWVKAVLPIRPGLESEAIAYLERPEVAGTDGLNEEYLEGPNGQPSGSTIKEVLLKVAESIAAQHEQEKEPVPIESGIAGSKNALPTETVFARGYDPLADGIEFGKEPFKVFSEWVEVLPTDQVVATEYSLQGL